MAENWIVDALKNGRLTENHLLPRKQDIAAYLGVSVGTVQNAIRYIEDEGHVESKQRIGTLLRHVAHSGQRMRKQTSKRDQAVCAIQQYILDRRLQPAKPCLPLGKSLERFTPRPTPPAWRWNICPASAF